MKKRSFNPLKLAYLIAPSLLLTFNASAQLDMNNVRDGENVEFCRTHKVLAENLKNPAFATQYQNDQHAMDMVEAQMRTNPNPTRQIYYIPVVFHVLHEGGPENITDEQIEDAVRILNRDYSLQNTDANNVQYEFNASNPNHVAQPADVGVQFRLATKAPDGTCFKGITRTYSNATSGSGQVQTSAVKNGNDVFKGEWPGNKYLNIFVVKYAGGAAGYTMTPSNWGGTSMGNGIYILSNYIGSIGTGNPQLSRALTHEVGHWLNLQHVWGPTNDPGVQSNCDTDDGVDDTPNCIGVTSCKLNENSCGPKANVENYMDYSYCSKMFTEGQASRMIAALNSNVGGRNNLWTSANLASTGADGNPELCVAKFSASNRLICAGTTVQFSDESFNGVQTRSWEFQGGTPATSTAENPTVVYATPGVYPVKLTVSNGVSSLTKTETTYIKVMSDAVQLPYFEGFEDYSNINDIPNTSITNLNSSSRTWEITNRAAKTGEHSMYINNYKEQAGNTDEFISPSIDLSNSTKVTLSFRYAVAKKSNSQDAEFLKFYVSKDCGSSYALRKTLTGTTLTTVINASDWMPSASDWITQHVTNITSSYLVSNFRFKLGFESNGGNNIYVDDINLYNGDPSDDPILGMNSVENNLRRITVYPNPASNILNVAYEARNAQSNTVEMVDMVGKVVKSFAIHSNEGVNNVVIDTEALRNGMYFIKVSDGSSVSTIPFVKQ